MFGPPGHLYTYRSYGIHICANVACGPDGTAAAALLRAAAIVDGAAVARARRGEQHRPVALARGPGNLCAALGITLDDNGLDLFDPTSPVRLTLNAPQPAATGPGSGSAAPPTGVGGSGCPTTRRCRVTTQPPGTGTGDSD